MSASSHTKLAHKTRSSQFPEFLDSPSLNCFTELINELINIAMICCEILSVYTIFSREHLLISTIPSHDPVWQFGLKVYESVKQQELLLLHEKHF
jgi:hypothetical protein